MLLTLKQERKMEFHFITDEEAFEELDKYKNMSRIETLEKLLRLNFLVGHNRSIRLVKEWRERNE